MSFEEQIINVQLQIHVCSCQMEAIVFFILQILFATHRALKIGDYQSPDTFTCRPIVQSGNILWIRRCTNY